MILLEISREDATTLFAAASALRFAEKRQRTGHLAPKVAEIAARAGQAVKAAQAAEVTP